MAFDTKHIIAYLEKDLSESELREFEALVNKSEEFKKEVDEISFVWRASSDLNLCKNADSEKNWNAISRKIKKEKSRKQLFYFLRSAAAILFLPLIALSVYFYLELNSTSFDQQVRVSSAYGTVTKTVLSDGTEVWLNSGSVLTYPQQFSGNKRIVSLEGEAYFKVSADKANRFDVVMPNNIIVSAYGTEFNINAYKEDKTIDVTLIKGNIEVEKIDLSDKKELLPGQYLEYNKKLNKMHLEDVNLLVKTGWKDGKMIFRRASMTEVTQRLSRHFNVDIRLEGKELYSYEYSATFTTESLNEILYLLGKTAPIKYKIIDPEQSGDYSFSKKIVVISLTE